MNEEQFRAFRMAPQTGPFLAFLAEWRERLKEQWARGEQVPPQAQAMAQAIGEITDLDYERDVKPFYEGNEDEG